MKGLWSLLEVRGGRRRECKEEAEYRNIRGRGWEWRREDMSIYGGGRIKEETLTYSLRRKRDKGI